ncbi:HNH endonuclease [Oceaniferula flava]|nr:HNH endonuclease [Oceaniferula flavus]
MRAKPVPWTREHLLIAMNLYCKLPFGSFDKSNALIIDVAQKMGRTASSLAMKLSNLASLDPVHTARGISGLAGASKKDRAIWEEFHSNLTELAADSEVLFQDLFNAGNDTQVEVVSPSSYELKTLPTSTETTATIRVRRGQNFFRQSLLAAYGGRCCVSGLSIRPMLIASHIKPWAKFPTDRMNLRNGLCLSSIHDAAFDNGLITFSPNFELILGKKLKSVGSEPSVVANFGNYEGAPLRLPEKLAEPDPEFMNYHREAIYLG